MNLSAILLAAVLSSSMPDSVYVTVMGTKFHAKCHATACVHVLRLDAESAGYTPCRVCFSDKPKKSRPFDRLPRGGR